MSVSTSEHTRHVEWVNVPHELRVRTAAHSTVIYVRLHMCTRYTQKKPQTHIIYGRAVTRRARTLLFEDRNRLKPSVPSKQRYVYIQAVVLFLSAFLSA